MDTQWNFYRESSIELRKLNMFPKPNDQPPYWLFGFLFSEKGAWCHDPTQNRPYRIAGNSAEKNSELMASLKETGKYEITADMKAQLSEDRKSVV